MNVWVVGGTSGIGQACMDALIQDQKVMSVAGTGEEVDVRDWDKLWRFACALDPLDILVYSAGITELAWSLDQESETMQDIMEVNCFGLVTTLQVLRQASNLPERIVVVGSDAAWRPMRTSLAYCASKAALHMAVKVLAREYSGSFRINCVAPGMTEKTKMQEYVDYRVPSLRKWTVTQARAYEAQQEVTPGRVHVKEVAEVVRWLALDAPHHVHGEIITVNGGRS